jgi:hypothetical protein
MKKITIILFIALTAIFTSCEGPIGPPGLPGEDGDLLIGTVFEITDDFTAQNDYRLVFNFPSNFDIYDTDVVLIYILWEVDGETDVWRLMPQTVILKTVDGDFSETDVLQYNFDYTVSDVQIFLEGTLSPEDYLPEETDNQTFRIAVIPADMMANKSVDINDFNSLQNSSQLKFNTIKGLKFTDFESTPKIQIEN